MASKQESGEQNEDVKVKTFHDLRLDKSLVTALEVMDIEVPSSIQVCASFSKYILGLL